MLVTVNAPMLAILVALAALTVWGAIAPRGQWRVLAAWTRREPYASEPSPMSVGIHRTVALLASAALMATGVSLGMSAAAQDAKPVERLSAVELMWGVPEPVVVNRVLDPMTVAPVGLMPQPVLRYQAMNGFQRDPVYLFGLAPLAPEQKGGYLGKEPGPGLSALDSAYIVVQVRADPQCVPRAVVAQESDSSVSIGVFYGRPDQEGGGPPADLAECRPVLDDSQAVSTLIPVPLEMELTNRTVLNLDGTPISEVKAR